MESRAVDCLIPGYLVYKLSVRACVRAWVPSFFRSFRFFVRSFVRTFAYSFAVLLVHLSVCSILHLLHSSFSQVYLFVSFFCVYHTAHSPDNSFLGFVVSGPVPEDIKPPKKKPIGLVYGKDAEFWAVKICNNIAWSEG